MTGKLSPGRPRSIHGGYSYMLSGTVPERRKYILAYLSQCRAQLCEDHGGEYSLSAAQLIIIDRIISKLGCLRLMEEFVKDNGVMLGADLQPCLQKNYLSFSNSLRRDLESIKDLAASNSRPAQTVQDLMADFDAKIQPEAAAKVDQEQYEAEAVE